MCHQHLFPLAGLQTSFCSSQQYLRCSYVVSSYTRKTAGPFVCGAQCVLTGPFLAVHVCVCAIRFLWLILPHSLALMMVGGQGQGADVRKALKRISGKETATLLLKYIAHPGP